MIGAAVKVTEVPAQIGPEGRAVMLTPAGKTGSTVITMSAEDAGLPVAQVALEVITTVIVSPFARVVEVKVASVAPEISALPYIHL